MYIANSKQSIVHIITFSVKDKCKEHRIKLTYLIQFISDLSIKEYRNRWFLFGSKKGDWCLLTLALDRIKEIRELPDHQYRENAEVDFNTYFDDIIGVTKMGYRTETIRLLLDKENAPYVITKPLHSSQKIEEEREDGIVISIHVIPNFELEKEILSFGDRMIVLSPERLRLKIATRLEKALKLSSPKSENESSPYRHPTFEK